MTRWKINEAAREVLEEQYRRKRFPSPLSKKRLAEQLDVAPRRIQVWFQNRRQREKAGTEDSEETHRQSPTLEDELNADDTGVASDLWSESTEQTVRPDWQQRDPWGSEGSESSMRSGWHQGPKGAHEWQRDGKGPQEWQTLQQQQESEAQQDALMMQGITNLVQGLPEDDPPGEGAPILSSSDDIFQAAARPAPRPRPAPLRACPWPSPCAPPSTSLLLPRPPTPTPDPRPPTPDPRPRPRPPSPPPQALMGFEDENQRMKRQGFCSMPPRTAGGTPPLWLPGEVMGGKRDASGMMTGKRKQPPDAVTLTLTLTLNPNPNPLTLTLTLTLALAPTLTPALTL